MPRKVQSRDQVLSARAPSRQEIGERLAELMTTLGLTDGYDWHIDDGKGLSNLNTVVLRSAELLTPKLVIGLARCLRKLNWELFVAEDAPNERGFKPIVMIFRWGAGPMPETTPREQAVINEANAVLGAEAKACNFQDT
jgi:hypothetical protein